MLLESCQAEQRRLVTYSPYARQVPTVAIIPVKSFAMGKQRLSSFLDPISRSRLGRALTDHVASTVVAAGLIPLVVTADREVAEWSTMSGFPSLADPGRGLSAAAETGVDWAQHAASTWIVLHSDLPLLDESDLAALSLHLADSGEVIAPSTDGGTSAIGSSKPIVFSFGASSFHRHLAVLRDPGVVVRPGFLLDIDSPNDLEAALSTKRGAWLRDIIDVSGNAKPEQNLY